MIVTDIIAVIVVADRPGSGSHHHHLRFRIRTGNPRTIGTIMVLVVKSYVCLTIIVDSNNNTIIMIRIDTAAMERSAIHIKNCTMPVVEDVVIVICHRRHHAVPVIIVHNRGTDQRIRSDLYDLLVVYCCEYISL